MMQRREEDSNRRVGRADFGIGDTVHVPGHGAFQVDSMGKRYFTGVSTSGKRLGKTAIGLTEGATMRGSHPWKIEHTGTIR